MIRRDPVATAGIMSDKEVDGGIIGIPRAGPTIGIKEEIGQTGMQKAIIQ